MTKDSKQFCRECNNMLYPKEDKQEKTLYLACRNCEHFEESTSPAVYSVQYKKHATRTTTSTNAKDMVNDPTLKRTDKDCTRCRKETVHVVFQPKDIEEDSALIVNYVCCKCYKDSRSSGVV